MEGGGRRTAVLDAVCDGFNSGRKMSGSWLFMIELMEVGEGGAKNGGGGDKVDNKCFLSVKWHLRKQMHGSMMCVKTNKSQPWEAEGLLHHVSGSGGLVKFTPRVSRGDRVIQSLKGPRNSEILIHGAPRHA